MHPAEDDQRAFNDVSTVLWRERQLLELLVFKLEQEQLILATGRSRWLHHAAREIEIVLEQIKTAELMRAVKVEVLANILGTGSCPALRSLAQSAPEPWGSIFAKHRQAFLELTQEIRVLSDSNRELLVKGRDSTREALGWLIGRSGQMPGDPEAYTASGSATHTRSGHFLVNEAI